MMIILKIYAPVSWKSSFAVAGDLKGDMESETI
jgi:hypothetical protein